MDNKPATVNNSSKSLIVAGIVITFTSLAILIIFLARAGVITVPLALLLLVALAGIYVGFGILIPAHVIISKLN